ncbi:hypothetical protein D3C84_1130490 [compost metagenome]
MAIEKDEKYGVEHGNFDIQLDQRSQAIDRLPKVDWFRVEVHFFNAGVGTHHGAGS